MRVPDYVSIFKKLRVVCVCVCVCVCVGACQPRHSPLGSGISKQL